jgi:hypothetical protein
MASESLKLPTFTSSDALALSVSGSCIKSASNLFVNLITRYVLSSNNGFSIVLSVNLSTGIIRELTGSAPGVWKPGIFSAPENFLLCGETVV